jgi:hypothetical protein
LNAALAHQIHPRQPETIIAGLVPAIHLRDTPSLGLEKGVDHRVEPGDDDYLLGLLPNMPQHFSIEQAGAARRPSANDALA